MTRREARPAFRFPLASHLRPGYLAAFAALLAILVYLNTLPNSFIFDDWQQIVDNPFLRRADGLRKIFTTGVWEFIGGPVGVSNFYRPLMHTLFWLGFRWFGVNPAGYHALSIVLHAAVTLLVFLALGRLQLGGPTAGRGGPTESVQERQQATLVAGLAAILFATHPVHTEAVAWISAYPDLLSALFSLLAIWLYLLADGAAGARRRVLLLLTGPVVLLGLLSKEIVVAVPAMLACYELAVRARTPGGDWRERVRAVWQAYASMAAAISLYLAARVAALDALMPAKSASLPPAQHLWTSVALYFRYLWVQIWPLELHAFYYMEPNRGSGELPVLAGVMAVAATLALGAWLYRRRRPEVMALPLYLLPLAPSFLLPYASVGLMMAERYLYLASVGFCWLAAAGLVALARRLGSAPLLACLLLVVPLYSARTVLRNADWSDDIVFYRQTTANFPGFPRVWLNLGEAYMRRGQLAEAREATEEAIRLDENYAEPHVNLGLIHQEQGDWDAAIRHYRRAAELAARQNKTFVLSRSLTNLAVTYRSMGRLDDAIAAGGLAVAVDPEFAGGHNNLGFALLVAGQVDEALAHFRRAVQMDPVLDVAHSNLGLALAMKGEWNEALNSLRRARELNPASGEVRARIGEVYLAQGSTEQARAEFTLALKLDPNNERAQAGMQAAESRR